jgi:signal transduction histidine kinase
MGRDEVRLLMNIGKQVGASVESAGLFEALQWQYRLTRAANRELESSRRQLKENLEQLGEANRVLESLDQMKNNFLTLASHELRTPLTYVLSSTELLSDFLQGRLSADEQRCLDAIHLGGKRLQEIVQDLIEVARLEAQNLYIGRERIDMPALVAGIGSDFHPILKTRKLKLEISEFPRPLALHGDPDRLRKALSRLVENAIKFTPKGGRIEICATCRTPHEILSLRPVLSRFSPTFFQNNITAPYLQLTVRDTGIGIEPEERVRIFDKFYELGDISGHFTSQNRFGGKGVGLGLTLVKGMVEAHGGMVWVESAGKGDHSTGSAFHLLLPLAPEEQEEERHATG